MKKLLVAGCCVFALFYLSACGESGIPLAEYEQARDENRRQSLEIDELNDKLAKAKRELKDSAPSAELK